jgi:hypothetical protein
LAFSEKIFLNIKIAWNLYDYISLYYSVIFGRESRELDFGILTHILSPNGAACCWDFSYGRRNYYDKKVNLPFHPSILIKIEIKFKNA